MAGAAAAPSSPRAAWRSAVRPSAVEAQPWTFALSEVFFTAVLCAEGVEARLRVVWRSDDAPGNAVEEGRAVACLDAHKKAARERADARVKAVACVLALEDGLDANISAVPRARADDLQMYWIDKNAAVQRGGSEDRVILQGLRAHIAWTEENALHPFVDLRSAFHEVTPPQRANRFHAVRSWVAADPSKRRVYHHAMLQAIGLREPQVPGELAQYLELAIGERPRIAQLFLARRSNALARYFVFDAMHGFTAFYDVLLPRIVQPYRHRVDFQTLLGALFILHWRAQDGWAARQGITFRGAKDDDFMVDTDPATATRRPEVQYMLCAVDNELRRVFASVVCAYLMSADRRMRYNDAHFVRRFAWDVVTCLGFP